MPPAYLIAQVEIRDAEKYAEYREVVPATIAKYDGEYLTRAGRLETLEGSDPLPRVVVIKFPSFERARQWYHSDEYSGPKALRQAAALSNLCLVEGVD